MDEVGRGSPAGPVMVGLVVLDDRVGRPPAGVRDSKLLTAAARERLVPEIEAWATACAVGSASPGEVDALGVTGALGLAGRRAIGLLPTCSSSTATTTGSREARPSLAGGTFPRS